MPHTPLEYVLTLSFIWVLTAMYSELWTSNLKLQTALYRLAEVAGQQHNTRVTVVSPISEERDTPPTYPNYTCLLRHCSGSTVMLVHLS